MANKILPKEDVKRQASDIQLEAALLSIKVATAQLKLTIAEYERYLEKTSERNDHKRKMAHD